MPEGPDPNLPDVTTPNPVQVTVPDFQSIYQEITSAYFSSWVHFIATQANGSVSGIRFNGGSMSATVAGVSFPQFTYLNLHQWQADTLADVHSVLANLVRSDPSLWQNPFIAELLAAGSSGDAVRSDMCGRPLRCKKNLRL
jgi:hypothetical protein